MDNQFVFRIYAQVCNLFFCVRLQFIQKLQHFPDRIILQRIPNKGIATGNTGQAGNRRIPDSICHIHDQRRLIHFGIVTVIRYHV